MKQVTKSEFTAMLKSVGNDRCQTIYENGKWYETVTIGEETYCHKLLVLKQLSLELLKGHDSLVLGAFGCGAFKTPPREMAQLFKEVMAEDEFKDRYRLITFAILSDHNDRSGNLRAFEEVIMA